MRYLFTENKKKALVLGVVSLFSVGSMTSCNDTPVTADCDLELQEKDKLITKLSSELEALKKDEAPGIVHTVYFQLKDNLSSVEKATLKTAINTVADIPGVRDLTVGDFIDLKDPRVLSGLNMVMQMTFDNRQDYRNYQQHPIHLQLKETVKEYMKAAPVVHDFKSI